MKVIRPVRSCLAVPADDPDQLAGALGHGADAVLVDLVDAVPPAGEETAREVVAAWLSALPADLETQLWVRMNPDALRVLDVAALAGSPALTGLVLSRTTSADYVRDVVDQLERRDDTSTALVPALETAAGVLAAQQVAAAPRVYALQLGEAGLAAETGMAPGPEEAELAAVRTAVVLAGAAAGTQPPLGPASSLTDPSAFEQSTRRLQRLGFVGRACTGPEQLAVVHRIFTPAPDEVAAATQVLERYDEATAAGSSAVLDLQGRPVDVAVLRRARTTLALASRSAP